VSAELDARRTAAAAAVADYRWEVRHHSGSPDYAVWADRLAAAAESLLSGQPAAPRRRIDGSIAASGVLPDGSASISRADLVIVLSALSDAAHFRHARGNTDDAVTYQALSFRLGDDR
jgi:hypothetical protein